ncbi:cysteine-rich KTR domain-containing protein [Blautia coccoides]|nr:cysteine-rich KTR domain-containing protein [Blautia coccoides]MCQ4640741.1 cysteine-rich KTR domain-containing protein [Blautia coccoides]
MKQTEWVLCPVCGNKSHDRIREDTVLMNCPLYSPKCKQETWIEVKIYN